MKTKFTPQYVLEMLTKVKNLSDQDNFNSVKFAKSYPSFYSFRKILIEKGLFQKKMNKEKWISIEPNMIMAKAIVTLHAKRLQEAKDKRSLGLTKEDYLQIIERNKAIKEDELEELEAPKQEEHKSVTTNKNKVYSLESFQELERQLREAKNNNASLIRQIGEIQNATFFGKKVNSSINTTDAKVEKLREVLQLRDTELAKANKKIVDLKKEHEVAIKKLQFDAGLWFEKEKIIYERGRVIQSQKEEISELIETISHQREAIKKIKNMNNTSSSTPEQFEVIRKINNSTAINILIQDIQTSSKLQTEEGEKLLLRLNKVLVDSYLDKERGIIIKHLFNFYAELSRKMNVPENLISENLTHAEEYFNNNFKE